ncbi:restriction endonuclease subunit S [Marinomonas transparens]|uniref:Restriction endonuclease subunit S n=1 Tax=Marinomonas transparens TaxID=2795388 RepID=A0A934JWQ5_9GAMM|nr:restriction endonuclease subunit S [Marinomonas transparens]MBJ7538624.1 restriction endonuclease subunit S [Marinomonas transparens]
MSQTIKSGYKQTEVGVIPEDWDIPTLGTFVQSLEAGISVNSVNEISAFSHEKHILKTSCVSKGYFYPNEAKSIVPIDITRAKTTPQNGSIIISRMNTPDLVGELGFVGNSFPNLFLPDRLWQMQFRSNIKTNTRWLAYVLSSKPISKKIKESATGTSNSMKNISKGSLLSITFPSPSFTEQTAIANALSDMDALLSELEKLIAKKQAIKTAAMQQLLTGKTRLPEFATYTEDTPEGKKKGQPKVMKTSELGEIPEDWEVIELGDKTIFVGSGKTSTKEKGDFPLYGSTGQIGTCKNRDYKGDSLLIARVGANAGTLNFVSGNYGVSDNTIIIKLQKDEDISFYKYLLIRKNLNSLVFGSGQPLITGSQLKSLKVVYPKQEEQTAIATILSDMDDEIQALEQRLHKTRQIKQGMMQELLTGKTRLPFDQTKQQGEAHAD